MRVILFIVLAAMGNEDGTYRYAVKDTCGKTYHLMMHQQYRVGDTIRLDEKR